MTSQSKARIARWEKKSSLRLDSSEVLELCKSLVGSLVEYKVDPLANVCVVAKAIYRLDRELNPERYDVGNLHRDKAIFASRRNGAPSGLGIIRAKVDELSQIFLIQDVLQRDWECVREKLCEHWSEEPPAIDRTFVDDLRFAYSAGEGIPSEYRSKPVSLKKAAKASGRSGDKIGAEWVKKCIEDGTLKAEMKTRQSYVFDLRQFEEDKHYLLK